jgi:hypothetical protein
VGGAAAGYGGFTYGEYRAKLHSSRADERQRLQECCTRVTELEKQLAQKEEENMRLQVELANKVQVNSKLEAEMSWLREELSKAQQKLNAVGNRIKDRLTNFHLRPSSQASSRAPSAPRSPITTPRSVTPRCMTPRATPSCVSTREPSTNNLHEAGRPVFSSLSLSARLAHMQQKITSSQEASIFNEGDEKEEGQRPQWGIFDGKWQKEMNASEEAVTDSSSGRSTPEKPAIAPSA